MPANVQDCRFSRDWVAFSRGHWYFILFPRFHSRYIGDVCFSSVVKPDVAIAAQPGGPHVRSHCCPDCVISGWVVITMHFNLWTCTYIHNWYNVLFCNYWIIEVKRSEQQLMNLSAIAYRNLYFYYYFELLAAVKHQWVLEAG